MRLLDKLRGHSSETPEASATLTETPACAHVTLIPHWDNASDMGDHSKVSSWTCESCHTTFSPAAVQSLRATEAARLKSTLGTN